MQYNFYFDICAICILVTLAVTALSRRWVPSYRHRAYMTLFSFVFIATLSERFETYLQMFPNSEAWYHPAEMILGSMYFIAHLGSGFFYLLYILSVLDIFQDFRKIKDFLLFLLPYLIGILLVIINVFTPILFYYDENGHYNRGNFILAFYVIAFYFLVFGTVTLLKYREQMRRRTKLVVSSYVLLVLAGLAIQFFFPSVLIENFFTTISIVLVYISLQNPSEMVDENLNILNRKAFLEGLELKTDRKTNNYTVYVTIDNIRALSDEIGYAQAQSVLKKITRFLKHVGRREARVTTYTYRYSEYVFAVTVHTDDEKVVDNVARMIAQRLQEPWTFGNMAIMAEGHCFIMKYPDDYTTVEELMTKLDCYAEAVCRERDVLVDIKNINLSENIRNQDYDFLARKSLDLKTATVKFQPVLSRIYRINYRVEAFCFMQDEDGNEVDMRSTVPDKMVTQALLDTDEFVYRKACRALAFWNGGDKNGKYRAVVGMSQGEISRVDFIKRIKRILREERAEASWIYLKISETNISTMNAIAERNLRHLKDLNCSIIVDKFGSGYGDLRRILSLPILQVNIDGSILQQASESEQMKTVARGIVNLFHDISIFVGATDIENEQNREMAEELGCDFLMGDYLGEPVKDSSFVKVIDTYFGQG